jgi:hypothetical protein
MDFFLFAGFTFDCAELELILDFVLWKQNYATFLHESLTDFEPIGHEHLLIMNCQCLQKKIVRPYRKRI